MISFEILEGYVNAHISLQKGENLIDSGLKLAAQHTQMYGIERVTDYWDERMLEGAIGGQAMEILHTWMWELEMGTCDDDVYPSDLKEMYETMLKPAILTHYASFITPSVDEDA